MKEEKEKPESLRGRAVGDSSVSNRSRPGAHRIQTQLRFLQEVALPMRVVPFRNQMLVS